MMKKKTEVLNVENIEVEYISIQQIIPYYNNPKLHPERQVNKIVDSMTSVRNKIIFHQPIVLDRKNVIIAGHGRRLAAIKLGLKTVPVSYLDVSEEEARALRIADNDAFGIEYDMNKMMEELEKINNAKTEDVLSDLSEVESMLEEMEKKNEATEKRRNRKESYTTKEESDSDIEGDIDDDESSDDSQHDQRLETIVCDDLSKELKGETEVKTPIGYIDVLTDDQIIEVKRVRKWKWALGQILVYGLYYPDHEKRIHLFGRCKESKLATIKEHCEKFNIVVTWQHEEFRP